MEDKSYFDNLIKKIIVSLKITRAAIENPNTDAHVDYYPEMLESIDKTISFLEFPNSTLDHIYGASKLLKFNRFFPLVEMGEKFDELEAAVFPSQKKSIESYEDWGIPKDFLYKTFSDYKNSVYTSVFEGLYRKGLSKTDRDAWSSIFYTMGGRTIYDYVNSVTVGWTHEDLILKWFSIELGKINKLKLISLEKTAHDSDRIFRYKKKRPITGEPDFYVKVLYMDKLISFHVEVQHATKDTFLKRSNKLKVPKHRVSTSTKYNNYYILIAPYLDDGKVTRIALIPAPLKEVKKEFIEAHLLKQEWVNHMLTSFLDSLYKIT